ncbi:MAG TPA: hypothetical protein VLA36_08675 [Longimicrobiales bacterium]|nr:hypothetical protein [Longimicrobiales bacterium]
MSGPWIRVPADRGDSARAAIAAGAVAAGVGLITFYLTRLLLAREKLGEDDPPGRAHGRRGGEGGA